MSLELDQNQLDSVQPFALVCSADLLILATGPSMRRALGRDPAGSMLLDLFEVERPPGVTTPAELATMEGGNVILRARERPLRVRCQPVVLDGGERMAFFGAPAISSEADLERLGLGYADFAPSDPTPDLLIVKRIQERSMHDLANLNAELERSTAELRQANDRLSDAERRYRALVEQQPLVTYIDELGEDVTSLFVSDNVLELTGYPAERWTAAPNFFFDVLHPEDRERVRRLHVEAVRVQGAFRSEFRLINAEGRVVWVHAEDRPVLDEEGRPQYRLGYMLDVTERRFAEEELRETGSRLTTLIGSLQAGILVEDENRRVVLTNEACCAIFGIPVPPQELVGADCREAAEQAKGLTTDPDGFIARIEEILARREPVREDEVELVDGRVFERDYTPIFVGDAYRGHLWAYRDVTPRREAQREVEAAHDEAVAASKAKSEFLATVSHEIRSPMHGVLGTVDLLDRTALDPEQRQLVSIVRTSAEGLLRVINDILDLQRAETGRFELVSEPVDFAALVGDVLDLVRARASEKGILVTASVDQALPQDLLGDSGRIRQVLLNLVANAVKFTDEGGVSVDVSLVESRAGAAVVRFVVSDTGIGIPGEQLATVFEPFAQVDSSSTTRYEGTGLGLAITRRLVERMNGEISLESDVGLGTTVTATVVMGRGKAVRGPEPVRSDAETARLSGTVLLAEDSPVNRELAQRQLARLGVEVRSVVSGAEAVAALEAAPSDVVLMDLRMPGMDGLEATRRIREREAHTGAARVPIVAMTANAMPEDRRACEEAGMDDFVTKPVLLGDLAATLRRWLPSRGHEEEANLDASAADRPLNVTGTPTAELADPEEIRATMVRLSVELGSTEAALRVADSWLTELPRRVAELVEAEEAGDAERMRDAAHLLKSTCALVGAGSVAALAARIEGLARRGEHAPRDEIDALRFSADRAAAAVGDWRDGVTTVRSD